MVKAPFLLEEGCASYCGHRMSRLSISHAETNSCSLRRGFRSFDSTRTARKR
jgi:hypothetical protein